MTLYHRTCSHSVPGIERTGELIPAYHPVIRRALVWMTDDPDAGRLALGLTGHLTGCDRMDHLFAVDEPMAAMPWLVYADRNGIDPKVLMSDGAKPLRWWVSTQPQPARKAGPR